MDKDKRIKEIKKVAKARRFIKNKTNLSFIVHDFFDQNIQLLFFYNHEIDIIKNEDLFIYSIIDNFELKFNSKIVLAKIEVLD